MLKPVFAMRDTKTSFMSPFVDSTVQAAIRGFSFAVMNEKSLMNYAPTDFELYKIGEYDESNGQLTPVFPAEYICNGGDVYAPAPSSSAK